MVDTQRAKYLLIGGGLAGGYAATAIRELDKEGRLLLISDEPHLPYDRVPLSKAYLAGRTKIDNLFFRKRAYYDENKVEILNDRSAVSLKPSSHTVSLDDGSDIEYERLLLATGGRTRKLSLPGADLKRIHYLRTIEDCEQLKAESSKAQRVVVVGGGFIGCELAAAFRAKGLDTTIVEVTPSLLSLALDPETATWVSEEFLKRGVRLITGVSATAFSGKEGSVTGVETSEGTVPADFIVVGVGIVPNTDLAERAGLGVDKGIVVNEYLETAESGVFAAGDVARFYSPLFRHHFRLEHYDVAVKHGKTAGANMAGARKSFSDLPYFFSFLFDMNINVYGDMTVRESAVRRGRLGVEKGFFQFYLTGGKVAAFLSMNRPREEINLAKQLVLGGKVLSEPSALSDESRSLQDF